MRHALALAARGLGTVWPNPAVGCVIIGGKREVLGRGWTRPSGRPHAETVALTEAGARAKGATAYVTLEPCAHYGKTPPCAEALVDAGVARVVIALEDPDPRVSGRGRDILKAAGIEVTTDICRAEAHALNAGFLLKVLEGRPLVTLKLATSLDGRIATATGESKWITGAPARQMGHRLRARHDAILVGIGTALADDPSLTCRLAGLEGRSPVRVVLDSKGRLPADSGLVRTANETPTWVITSRAASVHAERLAGYGVVVIGVTAGPEGRLDPVAVLEALAERGITRLLIEGGAEVAASFLAAGAVDRLAWFRAPRIIGGDGLAALGPLGLTALEGTPGFRRVETRALGEDVLESYVRSL